MGLFGPPDVEKMKTARNVRGLIKALGYKKDYMVRCSSAKALGEIGDVRAVEPLIGALNDKDPWVRMGAVEALGVMNNTRVVEPLITVLENENAKVLRETAAEALGKIGDKKAVRPLINTLNDPGMRCCAVNALRKIGYQAVDALIYALKDRDNKVINNAAYALGSIGDHRAIKPLMTVLNDKAHSTHGAVAKALGEIGDSLAVEPLISILKDENPGCRLNAAKALGEIGDIRSVEPLTAMLKDKEGDVRFVAAETLDKLGWKPDQGESSIWYWLGKRKWKKVVSFGSDAVDPLICVLGDNNEIIRERAAWALGQIADKRAVDPLMRLIKDEIKGVNEAAVKALQKIGVPQGTETTASRKRTVSHHQSGDTVLYAFFAQAESKNPGLLGVFSGGVIITHALEEWKDKIREETSYPGTEVIIVPSEEWNSPPIRSFSQPDITIVFPQVIANIQRTMSKMGLPPMSRQQLIQEVSIVGSHLSGKMFFVFKVKL